DEDIDADELIATFTCPPTKKWLSDARTAVNAKLITQLEVDALVKSCGGDGDGRPTKAGQSHINEFSCPVDSEWMKKATAFVQTGDIPESLVSDLLRSCGKGDGEYSRYCENEVKYLGTPTGCGDNFNGTWVDPSFCD